MSIEMNSESSNLQKDSSKLSISNEFESDSVKIINVSKETTSPSSSTSSSLLLLKNSLNYDFPPFPTECYCSNCLMNVKSVTCKECGNFSYLSCVSLMLIGCVFGCCLIPLCVDYGTDTIHSCPNCNLIIGRSKTI